ncbi:hypothetical protein G6O69_09150 [Pseudenhygromyxa sp. WMMC2535]|nr:hypothetical protein [Pseudenhygromyxa sp. WMMC2535]
MSMALPGAARAQSPITPESANEARVDPEQTSQLLVDTGALAEAAQLLWDEGVALKDPLLFIEAAELWLDQAEAERSIPAAEAAVEGVAPALDMLYFLRDSATSKQWRPIADEHLDTVIARAEAIAPAAADLIAEIEAEQAAALLPPEPPPSKSAKPGTGLIAGGSAALVVGIAGLGLGVSGLAIGAAAQRDVEDPLVYADEHHAAELRGRRGNIMAGVGLGLGGVGLAAGVALLVLGVKKRERAGLGPASEEDPAVEATLTPLWLGGGAGLGVVGRF